MASEEVSTCAASEIGSTPAWIADGGFIPVMAGVVAMFWGLAFICEEYCVPAITVFCKRNKISDDIAGSIFIGAGLSLPVLFASYVGLFFSNSAIGVGTVVGGDIFNHLVNLALSIWVAPNKTLPLDKVILTRECIFYLLSCLLLIWSAKGTFFTAIENTMNADLWHDCLSITWKCSLVLVMNYVIYCIVEAYWDRSVQYLMTKSTIFRCLRGGLNSSAVHIDNSHQTIDAIDINSNNNNHSNNHLPYYERPKSTGSNHSNESSSNNSEKEIRFDEILINDSILESKHHKQHHQPCNNQNNKSHNNKTNNNNKNTSLGLIKKANMYSTVSNVENDDAVIEIELGGMSPGNSLGNNNSYNNNDNHSSGLMATQPKHRHHDHKNYDVVNNNKNSNNNNHRKHTTNTSDTYATSINTTSSSTNNTNHHHNIHNDNNHNTILLSNNTIESLIASSTICRVPIITSIINETHPVNNEADFILYLKSTFYSANDFGCFPNSRKWKLRYFTIDEHGMYYRTEGHLPVHGPHVRFINIFDLEEIIIIDKDLMEFTIKLRTNNMKYSFRAPDAVIYDNVLNILHTIIGEWKKRTDSERAAMALKAVYEISNGAEALVNPDSECVADDMFAIPQKPLLKIFYYFVFILKYLMYLTIPDVRRPGYEKYAILSMSISVIWLAIQSYVLIVGLTIIGNLFQISSAIMGLTLGAWAASYPALWSSIVVARNGFGDIASCNAFGSNVFANLIGLGLPWITVNIMKKGQPYTALEDDGVVLSILLLILALILFYILLAMNQWTLKAWMIPVFFMGYIVYIGYFIYFTLTL